MANELQTLLQDIQGTLDAQKQLEPRQARQFIELTDKQDPDFFDAATNIISNVRYDHRALTIQLKDSLERK